MTSDTLIHDVLNRVAEKDGRTAQQLPPLHDAINPDALRDLVDSGDVYVEFRYAGYTVIVENGDVTVRDGNSAG